MVGSAKSAPGVTTLCAGLAMTLQARDLSPVLVEFDRSGGDLAVWWNEPLEGVGLDVLTVKGRFGIDAPLVSSLVRTTTPVPVLLAPVSGSRASSAVGALHLRDLSTILPALSIVDLGRLDADVYGLMERCADLGLVVLHPVLAGVVHAQAWTVGSPFADRLGAVIAGASEHPVDDVANALEVPVLGLVPTDPEALWAIRSGDAGRLGRTLYGRALGQLADAVLARLAATA